MIYESESIEYNTQILDQDLTFEEAKKIFKRYRVEFSEGKYIALGLRNLQDGQYTNLALLFSDQCPHTTKVAVFNDTANLTFKDSKEFGGSIFKQLNDAYSYLSLCNRTAAVIKGPELIEKSDYPEGALREALMNALIHRDYRFSGSIVINVFETAIEFISIGGLLPELALEDIKKGVSRCRNPKMAEVFHRLGLIEAYGTGIRRIFALYEENSVQPTIQVTPNTFKIILPNRNAEVEQNQPEISESSSVADRSSIQLVLEYLAEYGEMTDEELQELLNVKRPRAFLISRQMVEENLIHIEGHGNKRIYRLR